MQMSVPLSDVHSQRVTKWAYWDITQGILSESINRVNSELLSAVPFTLSSFPPCKHPVVLSDVYSHPCPPS